MNESNLHPRIAVCGDVMLDYSIEVSSSPSTDEKCTVTKSRRSLGGTGANSAVVMAQLGATVELYSTLSNDLNSDWLETQLKSNSVGIRKLMRVDGALPQATIILEGDIRKVFVDRGVTDSHLDFSLDEFLSDQLIYVTNPLIYLGEIHKSKNQILVVNLEYQIVEDLTARMKYLEEVDFFIVNEAAFAKMPKNILESSLVIETRGSKGVLIHGRDSLVNIDGHPSAAIDETGAGDTFAGTFCFYLASGSEVVDACRLATLAAGMSTEVAGTFNPKLSRESLEQKYFTEGSISQ